MPKVQTHTHADWQLPNRPATAAPAVPAVIPVADAKEILRDLCTGASVEKTRHLVPYEGFVWEIDEFAGDNAGLIVAEIELESEDSAFPLPPWIGEEVTGDPRYFNSVLAEHPFSTWNR